jgi:hypothetical protein
MVSRGDDRNDVRKALIYVMVCLAVFLLLLGAALGGLTIVTSELCERFMEWMGVFGGGHWVRHTGRRIRQSRELRGVQPSELASELIQQLSGNDPPHIIEAAHKLSEARDATAVPALVQVLERCVDTQQPGWRDVAEAVADALAIIGDRRALPLLYRLETVRGIGFIPSIRHAIAAIEPQSSLLRAGSPDAEQQKVLLRPVRSDAEDGATVLLRSVE